MFTYHQPCSAQQQVLVQKGIRDLSASKQSLAVNQKIHFFFLLGVHLELLGALAAWHRMQ